MKAITIKQPWASLIAHGIKDKEINDQFKRLGEIKSDDNFKGSDPRWKIEERAFEVLCCNELMPGEGIFDRSISKIE